jgi:phosphoribosylanthranilate isomerase
MAEAKICGITTPEALDAAIASGARYVGFVVYPKSPRHLSRDRLAALANRARGRVETVVVTVNADEELLTGIAAYAQPDWIQLHGAESPGQTAQARQYARAGLIKAIGVARSADLAQAAAYEAVADMLLFDAKPPASGLPGGNALAPLRRADARERPGGDCCIGGRPGGRLLWRGNRPRLKGPSFGGPIFGRSPSVNPPHGRTPQLARLA